jgi:uncharacterized membrane protein
VPGCSIIGVLPLVSLGLNLFLGGLLLGRDAGGSLPLRPSLAGGGMRAALEQLLLELPPDDRAVMRAAASRPHRTDIVDHVQGLSARVRRNRVARLLKAATFDASATAAAMQVVRERTNALQEAMQSVVLQTASQLSPAGRATLAAPRWQRP